MLTGDKTVDRLQEVFDSVARYFSVLGEPTRLRILHALCQDEKCVNDIIRVTGLAQANASRHLGLMYQAGMLSRRREGTLVFYKVADPMYVELCRTVTAQIQSRLVDEMETPPLSGEQAFPETPANQKEQASV